MGRWFLVCHSAGGSEGKRKRKGIGYREEKGRKEGGKEG